LGAGKLFSFLKQSTSFLPVPRSVNRTIHRIFQQVRILCPVDYLFFYKKSTFLKILIPFVVSGDHTFWVVGVSQPYRFLVQALLTATFARANLSWTFWLSLVTISRL
jgi:hypothetical protein